MTRGPFQTERSKVPPQRRLHMFGILKFRELGMTNHYMQSKLRYQGIQESGAKVTLRYKNSNYQLHAGEGIRCPMSYIIVGIRLFSLIGHRSSL